MKRFILLILLLTVSVAQADTVTFKLRRDTVENWQSFNPVLAQGEPACEMTGDPLRCTAQKVGDGVTAWGSLPYTNADFRNYTAAQTIALNGKADKSVTPLVDVRAFMDGQSGRPTLAAWQANQSSVDVTLAITAAVATGSYVSFPKGTFTYSGLPVSSRIKFIGAGRDITTLKYTGSDSAISNATTGVRIYDVVVSDLTLTTTSGAIGLDLDSVSTGQFSNLKITGFSDSGVYLHSTVSGGAVYNRFYNVTAQSCATGFKIRGLSSNANTFVACRANACPTRGWDILDCNDNSVESSQAEACGIGFYVDASSPGLTSWNRFRDCRTEGNTVGWQINSSNVANTVISAMWNGGNTTAYIDNGTTTRRASESMYSFVGGGSNYVATDSGYSLSLGGSLNLGGSSSAIHGPTGIPVYIAGNAPNNSAGVGAWVGNGTTLTASGARLVGFSADSAVTHAQPKAYIDKDGNYEFANGIKVMSGAGAPEGAVTATAGTLYLRTNGGAGSTFYVKESGTGNTGWAAK